MQANSRTVKALATVNDQNEIVIAEDAVRKLALSPGTLVVVKVIPVQQALTPEPVEDEESKRLQSEKFRAILERYQGTGRQRMLDAGYASVDEMMADIRPEW